MKFTIDPGDQVPTAAELQTTAEVLFTRLAVYLPSTTRDDVSVATDGSGAVSVALELPSPEDMIAARANVDLIARLQYVLKARGYIEFVGLDSLDLQPPPTIEPGAALFAGDSVESVTPGLNEAGQQALDIRLKAPAARALAEWSSAHVGSVLAIAIDGRVYFAPVIQAPLTDGELTLVLAGTESVDPLRLEALLRSGPLPYRLQLSLPPEPSPSP